MTRGTTPLLQFTLPISTAEIEVGYVTIQQNGKTVIEREFADCEVSDHTVSLHLTQAETLSLDVMNQCKIQLRVKTTDGEVYASQVFTVSVERILKDGEI